MGVIGKAAASGRKLREQALAYLFLAPALATFAVFLFYPMLRSVYLSMTLTNPRGQVAAFIWFDNYKSLFQDGKFMSNLGVTGAFIALTVPTTIVWSLILAGLTYQKLRGMKPFQFIFSMPIIVSVGTGSMIWSLLYHPTVGMLNAMLDRIGIAPISWLSDPSWALFSVSLMTVWMNMGFVYIVLLSGLQGISQDIYESAKIDGAGSIRTFVQIAVPLITPTLFFSLVVSIISAFQAFGQVHILTKGGPMNTTNVVVYSIYQDAFINFRFGIGSAQALLLFFIILVLTVLQFRVLERKVHYQ